MKKTVDFFPIEPLYRKPNGMSVQDVDRADLPLGFTPVERSLVTIPAGQHGGNHAHSRREAFVAIGERLRIYWQDEDGVLRSELINQGEQQRLVVIQPSVPHAIKNESGAQAVLLEYTDATHKDSTYESIELIGQNQP